MIPTKQATVLPCIIAFVICIQSCQSTTSTPLDPQDSTQLQSFRRFKLTFRNIIEQFKVTQKDSAERTGNFILPDKYFSWDILTSNRWDYDSITSVTSLTSYDSSDEHQSGIFFDRYENKAMLGITQHGAKSYSFLVNLVNNFFHDAMSASGNGSSDDETTYGFLLQDDAVNFGTADTVELTWSGSQLNTALHWIDFHHSASFRDLATGGQYYTSVLTKQLPQSDSASITLTLYR